jgi:hypothetical protein
VRWTLFPSLTRGLALLLRHQTPLLSENMVPSGATVSPLKKVKTLSSRCAVTSTGKYRIARSTSSLTGEQPSDCREFRHRANRKEWTEMSALCCNTQNCLLQLQLIGYPSTKEGNNEREIRKRWNPNRHLQVKCFLLQPKPFPYFQLHSVAPSKSVSAVEPGCDSPGSSSSSSG